MDFQGENVETEGDNPFRIQSRPSSRRTKSFSSSLSSSSSFGSSSFSSNPDDSDTPSARQTASSQRFSSGIPFSWEQQPGIPKKSSSSSINKKDPSLIILPLPPAASPNSSKRFNFEKIFPIRKKNTHVSIIRDPFITALMECSKDNEEVVVDNCWKNGKASSRTLTDRFGFVDLHGSCKRTCSVAESTILLPRTSRTSYDLINRRSG